MTFSLFILSGWFICIFVCYYLIRPIPIKLVRFVLTSLSCTFLVYITCQNLSRFDVLSMLTVAACWLTSIRLISLTLFSRKTSLTFQSFLLKILWLYFPILPRENAKHQQPIIFDIILVIIKLLINHLMYRWLIKCELGVTYEKASMIFLILATISYVSDTPMIFVRILTQDKYTLESFANFPPFSLSVQEFWSRRYSRIAHTILKESIYKPIRLEFSSSAIAFLITFIISGIFHAHMGMVAFGDMSSLVSIFMFFLLHGIACYLEPTIKNQIPKYIRWILTQMFLVVTSSLMFGPFIEKGCPFFENNPPPLFNIEWIPKLPVPDFCPR